MALVFSQTLHILEARNVRIDDIISINTSSSLQNGCPKTSICIFCWDHVNKKYDHEKSSFF